MSKSCLNCKHYEKIKEESENAKLKWVIKCHVFNPPRKYCFSVACEEWSLGNNR